MSDKKWFYSNSGEEYNGPISKQKLSAAIKEDKISPSTLIWKEGFDDWKQIDEVEEFQSHFEVKPPPLPNQKNTEKKNNSSKENESKEPDYLFDDLEEETNFNKELTNQWLKFYANIRIPLAIFFLLINIIAPPKFLLPADEILFRIIGVLMIGIYLTLFWGLYKRKLWGWKFNWGFIFIEPVFAGLGFSPDPSKILIVLLVGLMIYSYPNYVYFKKRKHLFS